MKVTPYGHICHKLLHSPVNITNTLIIRCNFFRFIGRKPITCPSNNCLQIMVCHAQSRLGWGNSRHLATPPLFPPPNDVWETNAEILYWWRVTPQIWVVLLIGCAAWEIWFKQSEALPRSGDWRVGLSRLCSATFEQLLAFGATFCGFSNLEQVLPFRAIFEQNIGLEHISSTKKSTISWKTSIHANFLKAYHVINLLNT